MSCLPWILQLCGMSFPEKILWSGILFHGKVLDPWWWGDFAWGDFVAGRFFCREIFSAGRFCLGRFCCPALKGNLFHVLQTKFRIFRSFFPLPQGQRPPNQRVTAAKTQKRGNNIDIWQDQHQGFQGQLPTMSLRPPSSSSTSRVLAVDPAHPHAHPHHHRHNGGHAHNHGHSHAKVRFKQV